MKDWKSAKVVNFSITLPCILLVWAGVKKDFSFARRKKENYARLLKMCTYSGEKGHVQYHTV